MNKGFGVVGVFLTVMIIAVFGVIYYLQNIESTTDECQSFEKDACALFNCLTPNCWCKEGPSGGVVYEKKVIVEDEIDAEKMVAYYLASINSGYNEIIEVTKPNNNFFNVVSRDGMGNEKYLTVSKNGEILETICGI